MGDLPNTRTQLPLPPDDQRAGVALCRGYVVSRRRAAARKSSRSGNAEAMKKRMRRVLRTMTAPTLSSLTRMVSAWARANAELGQADGADVLHQDVGEGSNQQAELIGHQQWQLVRSANRPSWYSLMRFSISPRAQ